METEGLVVEDFYYKGASLQPPHFLCGAQVVCLEYWLYTIVETIPGGVYMY